MEDLLPIGSVVDTNNKSNLMIIGYRPEQAFDNQPYDYICCDSKVGIKDEKTITRDKNVFYINHSDIMLIKYIGLQDKEFLILKNVYKEYLPRIDEIKKKKTKLEQEDLVELYENFYKNLQKDEK